jgi:hypothetical protein
MAQTLKRDEDPPTGNVIGCRGVLKPITQSERRVANLHTAEYVPWDPDGISERGTSILQLNPARSKGVGFSIYKMEPGARSAPH